MEKERKSSRKGGAYDKATKGTPTGEASVS